MFEWRADECPLCDGPASSTLIEDGNARRYRCTNCTDFIATRLACRELASKSTEHRQLMAHQARSSGHNEITRLSMEDGLQSFKKTLVAARIPRPVTLQ